MAVSGSEVIPRAQKAFSRRLEPVDLISPDFDVSSRLEARQVEDYAKRFKGALNRSNSVLVAFTYLRPEAVLWVLPRYIVSTVENFEEDDFILLVIAGALGSGMSGVEFAAQGDLGIRMKELATREESDCICLYLKWLKENALDIGLEDTIDAGIKLWCTHFEDQSV